MISTRKYLQSIYYALFLSLPAQPARLILPPGAESTAANFPIDAPLLRYTLAIRGQRLEVSSGGCQHGCIEPESNTFMHWFDKQLWCPNHITKQNHHVHWWRRISICKVTNVFIPFTVLFWSENSSRSHSRTDCTWSKWAPFVLFALWVFGTSMLMFDVIFSSGELQ